MGSLIPRKLVHQLLYAVEKLKSCYQIKLAIVGSGGEKDNLTRLIDKLSLHGQVKILSTSDNVAEIYSSNADCFISVPCEEVFGLTLAEASIAKLPIITSNITGIDEIYTDKVNALLVSPNNTNALINAIKSLIEKPLLRKKLAENAQEHIVKNFSLEQQFIAFNLTYQTLLNCETKHSVNTSIFLHIKTLLKALLTKALVTPLIRAYKHLILKFSWRNSHD